MPAFLSVCWCISRPLPTLSPCTKLLHQHRKAYHRTLQPQSTMSTAILVCLFTCLSACLSVCLFVHLSLSLSLSLSLYLFPPRLYITITDITAFHITLHLQSNTATAMLVWLFTCLSACLSAVYLSAYMPAFLSVCLVYLSAFSPLYLSLH